MISNMKNLMFSVGSIDNNEFQVLCNIDLVIDVLRKDLPAEQEYFYKTNGRRPFIGVSLPNLLLIKSIKTKNDALLNFKHDDHLVRYHCKIILKR